MCTLFSLQFIFEIFLILSRIQRDIITNMNTALCKEHAIILGF
jgi:hypothetical protein